MAWVTLSWSTLSDPTRLHELNCTASVELDLMLSQGSRSCASARHRPHKLPFGRASLLLGLPYRVRWKISGPHWIVLNWSKLKFTIISRSILCQSHDWNMCVCCIISEIELSFTSNLNDFQRNFRKKLNFYCFLSHLFLKFAIFFATYSPSPIKKFCVFMGIWRFYGLVWDLMRSW